MKTITIKELKNKELLPKDSTINNNKIFINNEIKLYMLYFKYKNSPPQNFWHEFFKSENSMMEFLESQKPFLMDYEIYNIIPDLTIEDHFKNQLKRDFNNLWLYSGDYSLDYNFNNKIDLWVEISESNYFDQLECLPPLNFTGKHFLVGEPLINNFHACLMKINGRYFGKYIDRLLVDYGKFENEIRKQYNIK